MNLDPDLFFRIQIQNMCLTNMRVTQARMSLLGEEGRRGREGPSDVTNERLPTHHS